MTNNTLFLQGWETAKGSVDKLSQTGWTPIKEKGQKVVEGFKTSVKHEEKVRVRFFTFFNLKHYIKCSSGSQFACNV